MLRAPTVLPFIGSTRPKSLQPGSGPVAQCATLFFRFDARPRRDVPPRPRFRPLLHRPHRQPSPKPNRYELNHLDPSRRGPSHPELNHPELNHPCESSRPKRRPPGLPKRPACPLGRWSLPCHLWRRLQRHRRVRVLGPWLRHVRPTPLPDPRHRPGAERRPALLAPPLR